MSILKNKGIVLALISALISGIAVYFNKIAMSFFSGPYVFTTIKNVAVALLLCSVFVFLPVRQKLLLLKAKDWLQIMIIAIIGGSVPFLLFFKGLSMNSAVSAAFIHKTLFVWVSLGAYFLWKEKFSRMQIGAMGVLLLTLLYFDLGNLGKLDSSSLLILAATLMWTAEFLLAKKLLKSIDPKILAWARMFFGSIILLAFSVVSSGWESFNLQSNANIYIVLSVILLAGYVLSWYHALAYLPCSVAASILVLAYPLTSFLNYIFLSGQMSLTQLLANILIIVMAAVLIASYHKQKKELVLSQILID